MKKKNLIVYYTCSGLTKRVADLIKEKTNGDIFEIELEKPYTKLSAYTIGIVHTRNGHNPKIKNKIDITKYNNIFLGTPIWAYTLSPALRSFIVDHSLKGKTIIPFCTDGGNKGRYFEHMNNLCKDGEVLPGLNISFVNKKSDEELKKLIDEWLDDILDN